MTKFNTQPDGSGRIRALFALVLALFLVGCSTIRFTYNNGDTLLYWWINSYVDLDPSQADPVREDIDAFFTWHRQTQLRDYAALLHRSRQQLSRSTTAQDLAAILEEIKQRGERLMLHSVPQLADLARSLKPEQIAKLEDKFERNNREYHRKFVARDLEDRQRARYRRTMEQLKLWFGRFSNEQEAVIRKLSDARPLDNEVWLQERMRRQRIIVDLVTRVRAQGLDRQATMALIGAAIRDNFARMNTPERKAYQQMQIKFYADVIALTTPEQRAHADRRMQGWIDEFNRLAGEKQT